MHVCVYGPSQHSRRNVQETNESIIASEGETSSVRDERHRHRMETVQRNRAYALAVFIVPDVDGVGSFFTKHRAEGRDQGLVRMKGALHELFLTLGCNLANNLEGFQGPDKIGRA